MLLRLVETLTRCILIPGIWIFVCWNIPEIREKMLSVLKTMSKRVKNRLIKSNSNKQNKLCRNVA